MVTFATDNDLLILKPDIFNHSIESFQTELDQASTDVTTKIRAKWYIKKNRPLDWDETLLTESQWKQATLFRALSSYILPRLSKWLTGDGDSFQEQITFYKASFDEAMADQFAVGIEYDEDGDDIITSGEVNQIATNRLWR